MQDVKAKAIAGIGRVVLWQGGALWIGRAAGRAELHSHHAIQISLGLSGQVRFRSPKDVAWSDYAAAIVLPHQRHQFDGNGQTVAQIFVEPETVQGRVLLKRHTNGPIVRPTGESFKVVADSLRVAFAKGAGNQALIEASQSAVASLSGEDLVLSVDPRITRTIEWCDRDWIRQCHRRRRPLLPTCRQADSVTCSWPRPASRFEATSCGRVWVPLLALRWVDCHGRRPHRLGASRTLRISAAPAAECSASHRPC